MSCTFDGKFESDRRINGRFIAPHRFVRAWTLSGAQYSQYELFHALFGMNKLSHTSYFKTSTDVWTNATTVTNTSLEVAIHEEIVEGLYRFVGFLTYCLPLECLEVIYRYMNGHNLLPLNANTDARWSSARSGMEATCTVGSTDTNKVLFRANIIRERNNDTRVGTFKGSAQAMEGAGLNKILTELQNQEYFGFKIYFETLTSDHDSTTGVIFRQAMKTIFHQSGYKYMDPTVSSEPVTSIKHITDKIEKDNAFDEFINGVQTIDELLGELKDIDDGVTRRFRQSSGATVLYAHQLFDVGHRKKNIEKSVAKLVKGFGKSCGVIFQKIVSMSNILSLEEQVQICRAYPFHAYLGIHELCTGHCKQQTESNYTAALDINNRDDRIKFSKLLLYFYELSWVIHCYQYKRRTQNLESNHRTILIHAPKTFDFPETYAGRADLALACRNDGSVAIVRTMELSGSECNDTVMLDLKRREIQRQKKKNKSTYKLKRVQWNAGLSAIHSVAHSWAYKGSTGNKRKREEKEIENSNHCAEAQVKEPKKKKQRVTKSHTDKCTGGDCLTHHANAVSRRRVIHKSCQYFLCAKCCAKQTGNAKTCNK
jgi:hypothetical protein